MPDAQEVRSIVDSVIMEVMQASGASKQTTAKPLLIEPQMKLDKDFGLDSLDFIELLSVLETKFDIELSDDVFDAVNTVDDLYRYMSATLAKKT